MAEGGGTPPLPQGRYVSGCEEDTVRFAGEIAAGLHAGDIVLLSGEMGAGKSVVSRAIGRAMGVSGPMPSPTFTLMVPYAARVPVVHCDLFRLEDEDAFTAAGLAEYIGGNNICLVEWPDRFLSLFDKAARRIRISIDYGDKDGERIINWSVD